MIPAKYSQVLFGLVLTCIMSLVISGISTFRAVGIVPDFLSIWMAAWLPSWAVAFPVVLVVAPLARRIVAKLVVQP